MLAGAFSARVIRELARTGRSPALAAAIGQTPLCDTLAHDAPLAALFEDAYALMWQTRPRPAYVFKAALVDRFLAGRDPGSACVLSEFRAGARKADAVLVDGAVAAVEIKSERDDLSRLPGQLDAFARAFASVTVVTSERRLAAVSAVAAEDAGIMALAGPYELSQVRAAAIDPSRIDPSLVFDSLRMREARELLSLNGIDAPVVPNGIEYRTLRPLFAALPPRQVHRTLAPVLLASRGHQGLATLLASVPRSLRAAVLATRLRKMDHAPLLAALESPWRTATGCGQPV